MSKSLEKQIKSVSLAQTPELKNKDLIWSNVESTLLSRTQKSKFDWRKYAAILAFGSLLISAWYFSQRKTAKTLYFEDLQECLTASEHHYENIIQAKYQMVSNIPYEDKLFLKDLFDEIEELDKSYQQQKEELIASGFNTNVFESMVEIQRLKLEILNIILIESKKIKQHEKEETYI